MPVWLPALRAPTDVCGAAPGDCVVPGEVRGVVVPPLEVVGACDEAAPDIAFGAELCIRGVWVGGGGAS